MFSIASCRQSGAKWQSKTLLFNDFWYTFGESINVFDCRLSGWYVLGNKNFNVIIRSDKQIWTHVKYCQIKTFVKNPCDDVMMIKSWTPTEFSEKTRVRKYLFGWNLSKRYKQNGHACLFHCINSFLVRREMLEHLLSNKNPLLKPLWRRYGVRKLNAYAIFGENQLKKNAISMF